MIKTRGKRIRELETTVDNLKKIIKKQAQEIEILNAKVGDAPLHVEIINANSDEAKKINDKDKDIEKFNNDYNDLIAQL